jgi:peroxiredoxin Q/BCP
MRKGWMFGLVMGAVLGAASLSAQGARPVVGEKAKDFTLARLDGTAINLASLRAQGPVVVLMLRGWVGYQCPFCNRQVGDFIQHAPELAAAKANVVLVYPGAADLVHVKAEDFATGKTMPANLHFVTDPDLKTVNLYGLRWDAPNETAYPTTFVVDRGGTIRFVKISASHGDRATSAEVLAVLRGLK